jgi:hypothetical protein
MKYRPMGAVPGRPVETSNEEGRGPGSLALLVRLEVADLSILDGWAREEGITAGRLARRLLREAVRNRHGDTINR